MPPRRFLPFLVGLIGGPAGLSAQNVTFSASGVYASVSGDDFAGVNAGLGVDGQLQFHVQGGFSLGGGYQYTSHGVDASEEKFHVTGFFAEARYTFAPKSTPKVKPYLGGRFAASQWNVSPAAGVDASAHGTAFGPVGGLLFQVASTAQIDLGIAFLALHFGDAKIGGTTQPSTSTNGSTMAFRVGLLVTP